MTKKEFFNNLREVEKIGEKAWRGYFRLPHQSLREATYIYGHLEKLLCSKKKVEELKEEMFACFKKKFKGHLREVVVV